MTAFRAGAIIKMMTNELEQIKGVLPKLYANLSAANFLKTDIIEPDFLSLTAEIKQYLIQLRKECDAFDEGDPSAKAQINFLSPRLQEVAKALNSFFDKIWDLAVRYNKGDFRKHQLYLQQEIALFFADSPYNKRVYDKPLGYDGDYMMMLYLYQDQYEGNSTFAKLIHKYSVNVPAAVANRNRKELCKKYINEYLKKMKNPRITSVASGPIIEIIEILNENPAALDGRYSCIDFDRSTIDYAEQQIKELRSKKGRDIDIKFINENILNLLKRGRLKNALELQDLIYSLGLIDYLGDKMAERIIENLYDVLAPSGTMIIGNVHTSNPSRAFVEMLGEWKINHRSEVQMLGLAKNIKDAKSVKIVYEESTKMNVFLIIKK